MASLESIGSLSHPHVAPPSDASSRPRRARFHEALAVVLRASSPAEAWETLASRGVIPLGWAPHPTRRFDANAAEPHKDAPVETLTHPRTLGACLTFASDPEGVSTAEALAWEFVDRLAVWGVPRPASLVWHSARVWPSRSLRDAGCGVVLDTLWGLSSGWACGPRTARYALRDRSRARRTVREGVARARRDAWARVTELPPERSAAAADFSLATTLWDLATREFLHVSKEARWRHRLPDALVGARVGAMRSPFEALAALYRLGYGVGPLARDTLYLRAVEA